MGKAWPIVSSLMVLVVLFLKPKPQKYQESITAGGTQRLMSRVEGMLNTAETQSRLSLPGMTSNTKQQINVKVRHIDSNSHL